MAELVGVVASGISIGTLAGQVANSVIKLKNAPEDVKDLINEIEILNSILLDLQEIQQPDLPSIMGSKQQKSTLDCIRYCREASEKLKLVVEDLATEMEEAKGFRRVVISSKFILRKDQTKKYKSRLKGTVRLLSLSEQCYTRAYHQSIYGILNNISLSSLANTSRTYLNKRSVLSQTASESNDSLSEGSSSHLCGVPYIPASSSLFRYLFGYVQYSQRRGETEDEQDRRVSWLRYRMPSWLANQVWEICDFKARGTCNFNLRVYNVVPSNAPVFEFVKTNNIDAVKTLFRRKEASPFDREGVFGRTPLHFAASQGNIAMCRLLLEEGADANIPDFFSRTPLHRLSQYAGVLCFVDGIPVLGLIKLLLNNDVDLLAKDTDGNTMLSEFRGRRDAFELLLEQASPNGFEKPLPDRIHSAKGIACCLWHNTPQLFRMALGRGDIELPVLNMEDEEGKTIMDITLRSLASSVHYCSSQRPVEVDFYDDGYSRPSNIVGTRDSIGTQLCDGWNALVQEFLQTGAECHHIDACHETPFLTAWRVCGGKKECIRAWLQYICDARVDLVQYGRTEAHLHTLGKCQKGGLFSFSYGPRSEDWCFWETELTDSYAGDFWLTIDADNFGGLLPGSWIE